MTQLKLLGRVLLTGEIVARTGLHIGGTPGALAIGNVDLPVIRNALNGQPYIPGSSLKGKMRSLAEKQTGAPQNTTIHKGKDDGSGRVMIHTAKTAHEYAEFWVNPIFGVTGDTGNWVTTPNRLIVRDVPLSRASRDELLNTRTDQPFTEVKWEAAIDRMTSAATPRQIERVPAGAAFGPMEMVFSLYLPEDILLFDHLLTCLQLLEDDYLGGQGSRGSGKVSFQKLGLVCKYGDSYQSSAWPKEEPQEKPKPLQLGDLLERRAEIQTWLQQALGSAQPGQVSETPAA